MQLMQEANVAVAPGIGFGKEGENYLRLAMVENEHRIRQALRQMRRALPKISKAEFHSSAKFIDGNSFHASSLL